MTESVLDVLLANGEPVEAVIFFKEGPWSLEEPEDRGHIPESWRGRPLSLEEAQPFLSNMPSSDGFGSLSVWEFYVWTPTKIFSVHEYDGSHHTIWTPRNPANYS